MLVFLDSYFLKKYIFNIFLILITHYKSLRLKAYFLNQEMKICDLNNVRPLK